MKLVDRIDQAIYAAFPAWGARRIAARTELAEGAVIRRQKAELRTALVEAQKRKIAASVWDSASSETRRGSKWLTSRLSADSELELDHAELRRRSRQQYRSNPLIASFVNGVVENVIGCGMRPQAHVEPIDGQPADQLNETLETKFAAWAQSAGSRGESFEEIQRLLVRSWAMDGEGLAILSDAGSRGDKEIPLTIEVIDVDRLETPPKLFSDPNTRLGITKDAYGRPVTYWIRRKHPGDTRDTSQEFEPVEAGRVLHLFEPLFPGQTRGIPPAAHVLDESKDLDDYGEAVIAGAQMASCFAVFIETPADAAILAQSMGVELTADNKRIEDVSPAMVSYLNPGQKVTTSTPTPPGAAYVEFTTERKRAIAAGLQYPYELMAKDWSGCNFSVGRLSTMDGRQMFRSRQQLFKTRVALRVWHRFVAESVIVGSVAIDPRQFAQQPAAYCAHTWITQGWGYLQPETEVPTAIEAIRNNLSTLADELAAQGKDEDQVLNSRARQVKKCRERGLPDLTEPAPGAVVGNSSDNNADGKPKDTSKPADNSQPKQEAPADAIAV